MIVLTQGTSNTIRLSLAEMSTLTSPTYLFEFISDVTGGSYTCVAADTSLYPARYNEFVITENDSPTPLSGEVTLDLAGLYTFKVYEQTSTTNLQPALADNELDAGKCRVEINGDRESTTYTTYNNSETVSVFDNFANEGIVVNPPTTVYENSDQSYQVTIPDGTTHVAPDITWIDSDLSVNTAPANTNITCTPGGAASGWAYQRPELSGIRIQYAVGDDKWQLDNGAYDYTPPSHPATFAQLDNDGTYIFQELSANNQFGNIYRFTDENGEHYTNPYVVGSLSDPSGFSTGYVIDHLTGLGWKLTKEPLSNWATALSNANGKTHATYSDWRVPSITELMSIVDYGVSNLGGVRGGVNYYPFAESDAAGFWSSSTNQGDTTQAQIYYQRVVATLVVNVNRTLKTASTNYTLICRNHYT